MSFKTQIASDLSAVFFNSDEFAESGLYTSKDGTITAKPVLVILQNQQKDGITNYGAAESVIAFIKKADVADPKRYDVITVSSVVYTVQSRISGDGGHWELITEAGRKQNPT